MKQFAKYIVPVAMGGLLVATMVGQAHAQATSQGLQGLGVGLFGGDTSANSSNSLSTALANILNIVLMVAGVIAFSFVLYGGFLYLTAGGSSDNATKGRTYIVNAIIGIVIIFLSLALVRFVIGQTNDSSTSNYGITSF